MYFNEIIQLTIFEHLITTTIKKTRRNWNLDVKDDLKAYLPIWEDYDSILTHIKNILYVYKFQVCSSYRYEFRKRNLK